MRPRIYIAVLLSSLACLMLTGVAIAAGLSKSDARRASVAKMNRYLASHPWAKSGAVRKCERRSKGKIACAVVFRGGARECAARVQVIGQREVRRARLGKLRCTKAETTAPTARMKRLGAFLGSAPKRNLLNPFEATYTYGATAAEQEAGRSAETVDPPAGVLALYSDGTLECAINVGTGLTAHDCPVNHETLGTYRVTTIYTSGSESATATEKYVIGPLPTSTSISVSYEPLAQARYLAEGCEDPACSLPEGTWGNADMQVGTLNVTVSPVDPWGVLPKVDCLNGGVGPAAPAGCTALPSPVVESYSLPVKALADLDVHSDQDLVEGEPIDATMLAPKHVAVKGLIAYQPVAAIETGSRLLWARSGVRPGYLESEAQAAIKFTPAATSTIVFR